MIFRNYVTTEKNKIRQEIQQQNETLKLENNNLQNHISNYAQSLKEKSKELEAMEHLSKENQYLHKREAFLCNQLIKQTELFNKLKTTKYIDNKLWQEIKEKIDLLCHYPYIVSVVGFIDWLGHPFLFYCNG